MDRNKVAELAKIFTEKTKEAVKKKSDFVFPAVLIAFGFTPDKGGIWWSGQE